MSDQENSYWSETSAERVDHSEFNGATAIAEEPSHDAPYYDRRDIRSDPELLKVANRLFADPTPCTAAVGVRSMEMSFEAMKILISRMLATCDVIKSQSNIETREIESHLAKKHKEASQMFSQFLKAEEELTKSSGGKVAAAQLQRDSCNDTLTALNDEVGQLRSELNTARATSLARDDQEKGIEALRETLISILEQGKLRENQSAGPT